MLLLYNNCFRNEITIYVIFEVMKKSPLEEFFSKAAILIFYFSTSIQLRGQTKTNTLPTMYIVGIVFAWLAIGTPEGTRTPDLLVRRDESTIIRGVFLTKIVKNLALYRLFNAIWCSERLFLKRAMDASWTLNGR